MSSVGEWGWQAEISDNKYMSKIQKEIITRLHGPGYSPFILDPSFVAKYSNVDPKFGFNGLGEVTYLRTYAKARPDGSREQWYQTIERVVNGTFNAQKRYIQSHSMPWNDTKAEILAREMYDRMFKMKFLPPGRGLQVMGTAITEERGVYAALNNCGFVSTECLAKERAEPFAFLMDMSMLGVGIGFDTLGAGSLEIKCPDQRRTPEIFEIPDTREGWVESVRMQIDSYFLGTPRINFDYSKIRGEGKIINGFLRKASGPTPLIELHDNLERILHSQIDKPITDVIIVDIMNIIGKAVMSGNIRRSAEIALGSCESEAFLDLKNYTLNPHRKNYGDASNNTVVVRVGMNYHEISKRIRDNGEPGVLWLEDNVRNFGRMNGRKDTRDSKAKGVNPCVEQSLWDRELCNLVEIVLPRAEGIDDLKRTGKFAFLYAKTVALLPTHNAQTNRVLQRNRRIGASLTGITEFLAGNTLEELRVCMEELYDEIQRRDEEYSKDWFTVPTSIKTTSIKPSGSVSLLPGVPSGVHFHPSEYYIRRMRIGKGDDEILGALRLANYHMEEDKSDKRTMVVDFPIYAGDGTRTEQKVSIWEQLSLAMFAQRHWADNQVSFTGKFSQGDDIESVLNYAQYGLKGFSMLPKEGGAYPQMPQQPITKKQYLKMLKGLKKPDFSGLRGQSDVEPTFCDSDTCEVIGYKR